WTLSNVILIFRVQKDPDDNVRGGAGPKSVPFQSRANWVESLTESQTHSYCWQLFDEERTGILSWLPKSGKHFKLLRVEEFCLQLYLALYR
ncbi:hypothetical protein SK128_024647, partial [Halocaridina rubra]